MSPLEQFIEEHEEELATFGEEDTETLDEVEHEVVPAKRKGSVTRSRKAQGSSVFSKLPKAVLAGVVSAIIVFTGAVVAVWSIINSYL